MFPLTIKAITPYVLSDTNILSDSAVEVTSHEFTKQGVKFTPYDDKLGVVDYGKTCGECGMKVDECKGHFGHIKIKTPTLNYMYIQELSKFLNCFCPNCGNVTLDSKYFPKYREIISKKRLEKIISENPVCETCNYNKIMYTAKGNVLYCKGTTSGEKKRTVAHPVSTDDVKRIFSILNNEQVKIVLKNILGINTIDDVDINFFILDMIPVIPIKNRPGHLSHPDDQTLLYAEIIKSSTRKKCTNTINPVEVLTDNRGKVAGLKSTKPYGSIKDKLDRKTGLIRGNCMGKRVNYSSRSPITDNPNVDVDELVVPYDVIHEVTTRVRVNSLNIRELQSKFSEYGRILTHIYTTGKYNVKGIFAKQNLNDLLCEYGLQGVPEKITCFRDPILCKKILLKTELHNGKTHLFLNDVLKIDLLEDAFAIRYFIFRNGVYEPETKEIVDIVMYSKVVICDGEFFVPPKAQILFVKKKKEPMVIDVREYFRPTFYINSSIIDGDIPCRVISKKVPPFICSGYNDIEKSSVKEFDQAYRGNILRGNKVMTVFPDILSFARGDFILTKEGKCVDIAEYSDYIPCQTDILLRRGGNKTFDIPFLRNSRVASEGSSRVASEGSSSHPSVNMNTTKRFVNYNKYKLFPQKKRVDATSNAWCLLVELLKRSSFPPHTKEKGIVIKRSNDVFDGILIEGDECEVQLKDGDYVMFGRQPSLHVGSMLTKKVKIIKGNKNKSFQFNTTSTATYNADFDGDEMNMQVPRNECVRAEHQYLSSTERFIKSPQSSKCLLSFKQDTATGGYLFTKENKEIEYSDFCDYLCVLPDWEEKSRPFKKGMKITARTAISCLFPPSKKDLGGFYYHNGDVCIENSIYKSGILTSKHYGSIVSKLEKEYGYEACKYFLFNFQKIIDLYLSQRGLSVGLEEMMFVGQDLSFISDEIDKNLEKTKGKSEIEINNSLNELNSIGSKIIDKQENSLVYMIKSGGKGKEQNIMQLVGLVGQQNVGGKRINNDLYSGRTLTCYRTETPESRGFVRSSFTKGMTQEEVFFHAAGGREGIIDTAVRTGYSGYISRKFMKKLEDYYINYRGEVRDANENIISFTFNDTLDPARVVKNEGKNFFVNVQDCVEKFFE